MDLKYRENKMQEKRKNTPFRDFLKEILSWRPLSFYKINNLISRYPYNDRIGTVVGHKEFLEKRESFLNNGLSYDDSQTFFDQMKELFKKTPLENTLLLSGCENSNYADQSMGAKNTYLSYSIITSENIFYTILTNLCTNVFNSIDVIESENIYHSHSIIKSYNIFYSKQLDNCNNIWFCTNMIGCHDCISCDGLENKAYHIENKKYSKKEYLYKKQEILNKKNYFLKNFTKLASSKKSITISENVTGKYIKECENVKNGFYISNTYDSNNVIFIAGEEGCKEFYDVYAAAGLSGSNKYYGVMGCTGGNNIYSSIIVPKCTNVYYSYGMESCSYCVGCIGLVNRSFCILNEQYTKEERYEKANKIFEQMNKNGILGDFFPGSMNPFYFNDTVAYLIDNSFTQKEVKAEGYLRRDEEIKVDIPEGLDTIKNIELNDFQGFDEKGNRYINPEILKKVIVDENGNSYRIIKMEYDFLIKHGLPLPEIHWLDRIKLGFKFKEQ